MLALIADSIFGKIAGGLLGIWLKDKEYLTLLSDAAIQKAQAHAGDALAARRFARFIQQIEDEVASSLASYLESEYRNLRTGDKALLLEKSIAVLLTEEFYDRCFEEAFDQERILDSYQDEITEYALSISVSDKSAALSIFGYCVAKFLAVLDSLPTFNVDALRSLIKDTDEILERIQNLEIEISSLTARTAKETAEDERHFRKLTSRRLRKIDVFGVDSRELPKRYDLSLAYLNLTLSSCGDEGEMGTQKVLSVALAQGKRLVTVKGDPGSGKTTLLSYIALKLSEQKLRGSFEYLNYLLPVFVRVREYAEETLPTGASLLTALFGSHCDSFTDEWVRATLRQGNFVFFIDGYDEVPSEKRNEISRWLKDLLDTYPASIAIVSCRHYAHSGLKDVCDEFSDINSELTVEPMNPRQVKEFINKWYKSFGVELAESAKLDRLQASKKRLFERINTNSSLRSLIRNPLICSLICFVNADRDGFVPDQRGELYDLATETLVERRERERGIRASSEIKLSKAQKFKVLGFIAEFFYKKHSAQLDIPIVANALKEYLPALKISQAESEKIVGHLSERSHVLRSPSFGQVDFSHKTFLEYFYARRLCEQGLFELSAAQFFDEEFREVFLFSMAIGSVPFVNGTVARILDTEEFSGKQNKSQVLTLYAGINQASELDPEIQRRALALLNEVIPPRSELEAEELAMAGEVILEPLASYANLKHMANLRYIVHAILNTFSEQAIYALRPFALLGVPAVDEILGKGRNYFEDDEQFRETVLRHCTTLKTITVSHWSELALVQAFPSLEEVVFSNFDGNWNDASLETKETITRISFVGARQIQDLSILQFMPNVRTLEVRGCEQINDFSAIGNLAKLKELEITSQTISDLTFLANLKRLRKLDLSECTSLENVGVLNQIFSLRTLYLPYSHLYDQLSLNIENLEIELDIDFFDSSGPSDRELEMIEAFADDYGAEYA